MNNRSNNHQGIRRLLQRAVTFALAFCLVLGGAGAALGGESYAASRPKLSAKKAVLTVGKTKTLKLRNARKRVKWSSSNKKVAVVKKKRGKYGATVTIKAKKAGKTTITAKIGSKKYKCKITVKKKSADTSTVTPGTGDQGGNGGGGKTEPEIKPLSASSVNKSAGYEYDMSLGEEGTKEFSIAVADFSFELLRRVIGASSGDSPEVSLTASSGDSPADSLAASSGDSPAVSLAASSGDSPADSLEASSGDASGDPDTNVLISPDSILTAMVMVENGAKGETLQEMEDVLSGGITVENFNKYIAGLSNRLCSSQKMIYQKANSIWVKQDTINVQPDFLEKNKKMHNADLYEAPFDASTVTDINTWVYNNSRNMINGIIDSFGKDDRMVLINTTAFEGQWAEAFEESNVKEETFTSASGRKEKAKMMSASGRIPLISLNGGKGFAKEYAGEDADHRIAFEALLPPEGMSAEEYAASLTGEDFVKAWEQRKQTEVSIKLPQFTYDYKASLEDALQDMGIRRAFSDAADLTGIAGLEDPLKIDAVLHKTHIELDEKGTKAAAATAIVVKETSMAPGSAEEVFLDRPFVYALVDTRTGIPLFLGIVNTVE